MTDAVYSIRFWFFVPQNLNNNYEILILSMNKGFPFFKLTYISISFSCMYFSILSNNYW